jgi:DNA modification methylase
MRKGSSKLLKEKLEWGPLATFVPNKDTPVYNWFYYKEGFARELVLNCIRMFGLKKGNLVLDPFCGSGTTLLACKERSIDSIGLDVLPMSVLASRAKTSDYDHSVLREEAKALLKRKFRFVQSDFPGNLKRFFQKHTLDDVLFFKSEVDRLPADVRDFFLLALVRTTMMASWAYKDGSVLKVRKHPVPPFRSLFRRMVFRMMKEAESFKGTGNADARIGDARKMGIASGSIDGIITSPPYLNIIDYTKVYAIENWFTGRARPALRSYFGLLEGDAGEKKYFDDMKASLKEMHSAMKQGAYAGIVVGNAYFPEPERVVEVDLTLAEMGEDIGFRAKQVIVLNKRPALKGRTRKVGTLRESMVVLEK